MAETPRQAALEEMLEEEREKNRDLRRHVATLRMALSAKDELLACYRLGKQPSNRLWNKLEKCRAALKMPHAE